MPTPDHVMARKRFAALTKNLRALSDAHGVVSVAFSGGLDSRFLIQAALAINLPVRALHVKGPHISSQEHAYAKQWATKKGVPLHLLSFDPLALPELRDNAKDRCFHCKYATFSQMKKEAGATPLLDGTNASDLDEYRPGLRALRELDIISPLADAGITKRDIRMLALETGLDNPHQTAQPCLLTRFAYGMRVTEHDLAALDKAEAAISRVLAASSPVFPAFRLRRKATDVSILHVDRVSLPEDLRIKLHETLSANGFPGTPVEAATSISGYFDRAEDGQEA